MLRVKLFQTCKIYGRVYFLLSILDWGEYGKCPHLEFSIRLVLDTVFKMSSLQWKTSKIYKRVCGFMIILSLFIRVFAQGSAGKKGGRGPVGALGVEVSVTQCGTFFKKNGKKESQIWLLSDATVISTFQGSAGLPGLRGTKGYPGLDGPPGLTGLPGLPGKPGRKVIITKKDRKMWYKRYVWKTSQNVVIALLKFDRWSRWSLTPTTKLLTPTLRDITGICVIY